MIPFWMILKLVGHLRVPANEETVGLDDSYHGGTAYPGGGDDFVDKSGRNGKAMNGSVSEADHAVGFHWTCSSIIQDLLVVECTSSSDTKFMRLLSVTSKSSWAALGIDVLHEIVGDRIPIGCSWG